jgi:ABC-type multidrug transport system fused ATPase/permease subunit
MLTYASASSCSSLASSALLHFCQGLRTSLLGVASYSSSSVPPLVSYTPRSVVPPGEWPHFGGITFESVTLCYRPSLPPALRDVSFTIAPRERICVVGRTGGGKSSLLQALFGMRTLTSGRITVDGLDIRSVGRRLLRSRMSIIPQSPVLYAGTIRANLWPYGEAEARGEDEEDVPIAHRRAVTDDEIWQVLKQCKMEEKIRGMKDG